MTAFCYGSGAGVVSYGETKYFAFLSAKFLTPPYKRSGANALGEDDSIAFH